MGLTDVPPEIFKIRCATHLLHSGMLDPPRRCAGVRDASGKAQPLAAHRHGVALEMAASRWRSWSARTPDRGLGQRQIGSAAVAPECLRVADSAVTSKEEVRGVFAGIDT